MKTKAIYITKLSSLLCAYVALLLPPLLAYLAKFIFVHEAIGVHSECWKDADSSLQNCSFVAFVAGVAFLVELLAIGVDGFADGGRNDRYSVFTDHEANLALDALNLLAVFFAVLDKERILDASGFVFNEHGISFVALGAD